MYRVMQSMTRTSQQVRRGVLEFFGSIQDFSVARPKYQGISDENPGFQMLKVSIQKKIVPRPRKT